MNGAIFLDRDGTINASAPESKYVTRPEDFHFLPGALDALGFLAKNSERQVVICTNQACIGKGLCTGADVAQVHLHMMNALACVMPRLPQVYVCPHAPEEGCVCRKPAPGLLIKAARNLDLDLSASVVVGDWSSDLRAGWAAGVPEAYLVLTGRRGKGKYPRTSHLGRTYETYDGLWAVAQAIVRKEKERA